MTLQSAPDPVDQFRAGTGPVPASYSRWHLRGAGLDSLTEEVVELPKIAPDQLVVRHDACGICFSDIKVLNLGPNHPRLIGRDMVKHPVVLGHEVALTIVKVGDALTGQFAVGQRFIVQADVYYNGVNLAYGYALDGGMAQYGVVGDEVLRGDEGCYLLPIRDDTGYVEAALVEPWACVVAAYQYPNYRRGIQEDGALLVYAAGESVQEDVCDAIFAGGHRPVVVEAIREIDDYALAEAVDGRTEGLGFDDILVFGTPSAKDIEKLSKVLAKKGIMNLALTAPLTENVVLDVGRMHYDQLLYIGGVVDKPERALDAYSRATRPDLLSGGKAWFIGAGGPMGQMHIQRAVMHEAPPKTIIITDVSDERLARVKERFGDKAAARGIALVLLNPQTLGEAAYEAALASNGPFDDIVCLVPNADIVAQTAPNLAPSGLYNIFAGVAKGVSSSFDLNTILAKGQRFVGTSGSSIADLKMTLDLVEADKLSTNASLAAIGGLHAYRDGLAGVRAGAFPGKTVIFPHIADLPLLSMADLQARLPNVYAKLEDGKFWTKEAEEELLKEKLAS
jgi:threonine dehydrogenase-like Zn-dependent dehydrogenase